jgi:hypothetical protein
MAREKPIPRSARRNKNRGFDRSRNDDNVKNFSIGLMDIDATIMYYFNNVIKPKVVENDELIKVPIMYANPERWAMIQKSGFLFDNKQQLIIPLIAFKRTSIEKDDQMSVDKLDPLNPKLQYTFQKQYSDKNRYDKFSVQQGLNPTKELYSVAVPDYVKLQYEFVIWCTYTEQMNSIVEKLIYSEGAYWGEDGRFKFRTQIDNYTDASEVTVNSERIIKTTFSVTMNGYLLPEEFSDVVTTQKKLTPKRILIGDDVSLDLGAITKKGQDINVSVQQKSKGGGLENPFSIVEGTGVSIVGAGTFDGTSTSNFQFSIGQDVGTSSTVQFQNVTASNVLHIGPTSFEISQRDDGKAQVNTDWVVQGDIIAENYIVSSSVMHITSSFKSGSTISGDTLDDNHQFTGSVNITGSLVLNGNNLDAASSTDTYLRKSFVKKSNSVSSATASFNAVTASAPTGLSATNEQDFVFFINGQYMEHDALEIQQNSTTFLLKVNTTSIGYDLESDDEIIAQGKFNS